MEQPEQIHNPPSGCTVCGRKDETLRLISYPFVFSLLVVTFRRAFTGVWCARHRAGRQLLASLITALFGWIGIPFGFIFSPIALFQLARGGVQDKAFNSQMLALIGREKLSMGDTRTAIKCFEESLRLQDNPEVRDQLIKLQGMQRYEEIPQQGLFGFLSFAIIPAGMFILGLLVGLLDYGFSWLISGLFQGETNIFFIILSWVPLVALIFLGLLLLQGLLAWTLKRLRVSQGFVAGGLAFLSSLLAIYGVATGETVGRYFTYISYGMEFSSFPDVLLTTLAVLTRGGIYQLLAATTAGELWGVVLIVFLLLSVIFYLLVTLPSVHNEAEIQSKLRKLNAGGLGSPKSPGAVLPLWGGIAAVLIGILLLFFLSPQKSSVDALEAFDHFSNGYTYISQGDLPSSEEELISATLLRPNVASTYISLGDVNYSQGDFAQARDAYQQAIQLNENAVSAHTGLGWAFYQLGNLEGAMEEFSLALNLDPSNPIAHDGMGWIYLDLDVEQAITSFEAALEIDTDYIDAITGLGYANYLLGDYTGAQEVLQKAIELNPDNSFVYTLLGYVYSATDERQLAAQAFEKAIDINPGDFYAFSGLGDLYYLDHNWDLAIKNYQEAINLFPNATVPHIRLGLVYLHQGNFPEAQRHLEKSIDLDPASASAHAFLAFVHYQLEEPDDAEAELELALSSSVDDYQDHYSIAWVYGGMNLYELAELHYLQAIELAPSGEFGELPRMYSYLAMVYALQGKFDQAQQAVDVAMEIDARESEVYISQAMLWIEQQELDRALEAFKKAIELDADSTGAYAGLSFVHFLSGEISKAVEAAEASIGINIYNADAYTYLAFSYHSQGRLDDARVSAEEAVRLYPTYGLAHYILGKCYMDDGQNDLAITEFEKFLQYYWERAYDRDYKILAEQYLIELRAAP